MPTLLETINAEWKTAALARNSERRDTLNLLRAAVKSAEINSRGGDTPFDAADDAQVQSVIEREAKKRRDSVEEYTKANRTDLADKETAELKILAEFLPTPFSDEELEALVREAIAESGASNMKEMGAVMKAVQPKVAGRADGRRVNEVVRRLLA
ncbi:MAG TPA: GatB/YqeY domain-containing protein [Abditibacteriaceae bacterium]|jgi:hypothetical protein